MVDKAYKLRDSESPKCVLIFLISEPGFNFCEHAYRFVLTVQIVFCYVAELLEVELTCPEALLSKQCIENGKYQLCQTEFYGAVPSRNDTNGFHWTRGHRDPAENRLTVAVSSDTESKALNGWMYNLAARQLLRTASLNITERVAVSISQFYTSRCVP